MESEKVKWGWGRKYGFLTKGPPQGGGGQHKPYIYTTYFPGREIFFLQSVTLAL